MAALDTNILVRYLVRDDARQLALAHGLMARAIAAGDTLFVPATVVIELEWVLRASFGFAKPNILTAMTALLSVVELLIESEPAIEVALRLYEQGSADFADCVHIGLAHQAGETPLWTFDKACAKVDGASLLTT